MSELGTAEQPLCELYDLAMLDLDGVVYVSGAAIPGAAEAIGAARDAGMRVAFVTNNASRPPEQVSENLNRLGVRAEPGDVVTSAQAAARLLRGRHGPGAPVLALGAAGLVQALAAEGLQPIDPNDAEAAQPVALATGYGPDVRWRHIMRAAVLVRDGLPWVASNADMTIPTSFGTAPGHGVLVETLSRFSGVTPVVAGKPQRPLLEETIRRVGGSRPLMVGDRLDTDIDGGRAAGLDTLLVLTGVTDFEILAAAPPELRPTFISVRLDGLLTAHRAPTREPEGWSLGGWTAVVRQDRLQLSGSGDPGDWWRAAAVAAWEHLDRAGTPATLDGQPPEPPDAAAAAR